MLARRELAEIRDPGLDKEALWGPGPWVNEPDMVSWRAGSVMCAARRTQMGIWCGYVGVMPGHPWYGKRGEVDDAVDVHGGVTFAEEGPAGLWLIGFDCGHASDLIPSMAEMAELLGGEYRTIDYAMAEVEKLAFEAQRILPGTPPLLEEP